MKSTYSASDQKLLEHLFRIHGKPEKGYGNLINYYRKVAKAFNEMTTGKKRSPSQVRNYHQYIQKRSKSAKPQTRSSRKMTTKVKNTPPPPRKQQPMAIVTPSNSNEIVCKNIRSLSSPAKKTKTGSSNGYAGQLIESKEEYRSLADDLPKSWEYTEIGFLGNGSSECSSTTKLHIVDRDEPHIFDDIEDLPLSRTSITQNGMSSDLVNFMAEQARQHHKLKMKMLKDKFQKVTEVYKMKMFILENELDMKRREHEKKMDILMQKYKKAKNGYQE